MPKNTDVCKECGHEYGIHSTDGERCPKNNGQLINGQLDFYTTHFDDGLYSTDQLRAKIDEQAATIARLTAAHEMQGESLVVLPRWMVSNMEDKLKEQAEEIRALKQEITERIEEDATRARES